MIIDSGRNMQQREKYKFFFKYFEVSCVCMGARRLPVLSL